ncbi:MAG: ABC transporter substrate-binding protein [Anaerovoracaceae bacterium]
MKIKKMLVAALSISLLLTAFAGCGTGTSDKNGGAQSSAPTLAEGNYNIGISQFAEHASLDNCREGFIAGLADAGIVEGKNLVITYDNAQTDTGTASTIAESYISKGVDMIAAIATPSAQAAFNSAMSSNIPVIYTAVSDPVASGFATADGKSTGEITGSSDILPVEEQLKMIRRLMPDAKKIGILYTTSETNSVSAIDKYKELAPKYNFEIVTTGINTISDVDLAASDIITKVDCLCNLTDNTVVEALQTVLDKANKAGIPVFGSEIEQVRAGCTASMGIDYYTLGKQTGELAAKILKGEAKASQTPFITATKADLYVNTAAAEKINFSLDKDYISNAVEVFDKIEA